MVIARLENGYVDNDEQKVPPSSCVKNYLSWQRMSQGEQARATTEWDKYYVDVKKTRSYMLFKEMSQAVKANDFAKIAELKEEASAMYLEQYEGNRELEIPNIINPYDFLNSQDVLTYMRANRELRNLDRESKALEGIFI